MIVSVVPKLKPLLSFRPTIVTQIVRLPPQRQHFTMQNGNSERPALILDFDGTITIKDTISTLASFVLPFQRTRNNNIDEIWNNVLTKYSADYSKHIQNYKPAKEERQTLKEEIEYYRCLRQVELNSFERVSTSGLFKGVDSKDWKRFGHEAIQDKRVEVRNGFQDFVARISERGSSWGIVSVNFSSHFIRGVLEASIGNETAKVNVLANSITEEGSIVGPGSGADTSRAVLATSDTKLFAMKELGIMWNQSSQETGRGFDRLVYIGDSGTDIECLTAENVIGIVMSDDGLSELMKTLKRVGKVVIPIQDFTEAEQAQLYWARDFIEILNSPFFITLFQED